MPVDDIVRLRHWFVFDFAAVNYHVRELPEWSITERQNASTSLRDQV